ncbi:MAG: hypothetical protein V7K27_35605 [Nostoc sp.]
MTTSTGQILQTKEMVGVNDFPPALILVDGLYLFLMLKTPTSAFYRETSYYLFDPTPRNLASEMGHQLDLTPNS